MLAASRRRILDTLGGDDLVLDVGGGANPFARADWVIDLQAYERRGLYVDTGDPSPGPGAEARPERFSAATWVQRDICAREPWPFSAGQFDFAVCSHTLEDVRDPVFVCDELMRVARAGYIEVPSRLQEQSAGVHGPWVGWSHHHWLVDVAGDEITFVFKPHALHGMASHHFPAGFHERLSPEQRVASLWWSGRFHRRERIFLDADSLDAYLSELVERHGLPTPARGLRGRRPVVRGRRWGVRGRVRRALRHGS
jgi:hypothetical protein